jgi:hypothetical protein
MYNNSARLWLKVRFPHPVEKVRETLLRGGGSDFQNNSYWHLEGKVKPAFRAHAIREGEDLHISMKTAKGRKFYRSNNESLGWWRGVV